MATRLVVVILLALSPLPSGAPAHAATLTISGVVSGPGGPVGDATVDVRDTSGATVASTSTDSLDGSYSVTADAGTRYLFVTPPDGSGLYPSKTAPGVYDADRGVDVLLYPSLTLHGDVGVEGADISFQRANGTVGADQFNVQSDSFTVVTSPGNAVSYQVSASNDTDTFSAMGSLDIDASAPWTTTVPIVPTSVHIQDQAGHSVGGCLVTTFNWFWNYDGTVAIPNTYRVYWGTRRMFDSTGDGVVPLLDTTQATPLTVTCPSRPTSQVSIQTHLNNTLTVTLADAADVTGDVVADGADVVFARANGTLGADQFNVQTHSFHVQTTPALGVSYQEAVRRHVQRHG